MIKKTGIYERIDKSSLGTSQARAARRSVSEADAAKVVARATRLPANARTKKKRRGG